MLLEMGRGAEALLAWEHCLTLCPHFQPAQSEMEKVCGPVVWRGPVPSCHSGRCPVPLKDSCPSRSCCSGLVLGASEVGSWAMSFPLPRYEFAESCHWRSGAISFWCHSGQHPPVCQNIVTTGAAGSVPSTRTSCHEWTFALQEAKGRGMGTDPVLSTVHSLSAFFE